MQIFRQAECQRGSHAELQGGEEIEESSGFSEYKKPIHGLTDMKLSRITWERFDLSRANEYNANNHFLIPLWHVVVIKFQWHSGLAADLIFPFEQLALRN
jgi:hypothetical protein